MTGPTRCPCCGQLDESGRRNERAGNAMVVCSLVGLVGVIACGVGYAVTGAWGWLIPAVASFVVFCLGGVFAHFYDPEVSQ